LWQGGLVVVGERKNSPRHRKAKEDQIEVREGETKTDKNRTYTPSQRVNPEEGGGESVGQKLCAATGYEEKKGGIAFQLMGWGSNLSPSRRKEFANKKKEVPPTLKWWGVNRWEDKGWGPRRRSSKEGQSGPM